MQISTLLQQLPTRALRSVRLSRPETDILAVLVLQREQQEFHPDCLYVGEAADLPAQVPGGCSVLLRGTPEQVEIENGNAAFLSPSASLAKVVNKLQETLLYQQRVLLQVSEMTSSLLNYQGLQDLVCQASDLLGNPIFLVDQENRYVAWDSRPSGGG